MKKVAALLALALAAFALVACGGDDSDTTATGGGETTQEAETGGGQENGGGSNEAGGGGGATLSFEADPDGALAYTTTEATTKAGKVTLELDNPQSLSHDVVIEDSSGKEVGATEVIADDSDSTTVNLKPGTYTFFCSVPGHREAGMEGTLTVE
jgi:plastocyanin